MMPSNSLTVISLVIDAIAAEEPCKPRQEGDFHLLLALRRLAHSLLMATMV